MAQNGKVGIRPIGLSPMSTDLVVSLDPMYTESYSGTGIIWNDLSMRKNDATFINEPVFDTANDGIIKFEGGNYAMIADNPTLEFGNEAFTVEVWVRFNELNPNPGQAGYQCIVSKPGNSDGNGFMLYLEQNSTITAVGGNEGWQVIMSSDVVPVVNEWYHIVVNRMPSGVWNLCINGTEQSIGEITDQTFTFPDNDTNMYVGTYTNFPGYSNQPSGFLNGYIGMVRVYEGLALSLTQIMYNYQENLIRFGNGISLDMPFVEDLNDHSQFNHAVTLVGGVTLGTPGAVLNNQYPYTSWDPSSAKYLRIDNFGGFANPFNKNFTIETWFKFSQNNYDNAILGISSDDEYVGSHYNFALRINSQGVIFVDERHQSYSTFNTNMYFTFENDNWYHVAVVKKDNMIHFYVNGNLISSNMWNSSSDEFINSNNKLYIGAIDGNDYLCSGTIGSIRLYKKAISAQIIKNNFDANLSTYESSVNGWTLNDVTTSLILKNGAQYNPTTDTFIFDGINDYAETNYVIPEGDFSFGAWAKSSDSNDWSNRLMGNSDSLQGNTGIDIIWQSAGQGIIYSVRRGNGGEDLTSTNISDLSVLWNHVVVTYSQVDGLVMYVNGQEVGRNSSLGFDSTLPFRIGRSGNGTDAFYGRVSNVFLKTTTLSAADVLGMYNNTKDNYNLPSEVFVFDPNDSNSYSIPYNQVYDLVNNTIGYTSANSVTVIDSVNGGILSLDNSTGLNNRLYFMDNYGFCTPKKLSLEAWVNLNNYNSSSSGENYRTIASYSEGGMDYFLEFAPNGTLQFGRRNQDTNELVTDGVVINPADFNNKWNHILSTYEDGSLKIYVNGVLLLESNIITGEIIRNPFQAFIIGYNGYRSVPFDGSIGLIKVYDYVLNVDQVNASYNERKARFADPNASLLLNYDINNTNSFVEGETVIHSLVNSYDGTLNNGVAFTTETINGNVTKSLVFDGNDDFIQIPNAPKPTTAMSVSAWIKPSQLGGWRKAVIFPYGENSWDAPYFSYQIVSNGNNIGVGFGVDSDYNTGSLFSSTDAVVDAWYHVVGTFDSGVIKLYINGQLVDTKDVTNNGTSIIYTDRTDLIIGLDAEYFLGEQFAGNISSVKVYENALAPAHVLNDYNQTKANFQQELATGMYSLRKVNPLYSGNSIKVRRSSDNTEQEIGFVNGELDVDSLTSFAGSGNAFVSVWYDQSGNDYHLLQSSSSKQPKIVSSGSVLLLNGKPAINFENSSSKNQVLKTNVTNGMYDTYNLVGLVVGSRNETGDGSTTYSRFLSFAQDGQADYNNYQGFLIASGQFDTAWSYCAGNVATSNNYTYGAQALFAGSRSYSTDGNYVIGISVNDNTPSYGYISAAQMDSNVLRIGNDPGEQDSKLNGFVQEAIIYDKDVVSQLDSIKTGINSYYNIYQTSAPDADKYSLILNFEGNFEDNGGDNLVPTISGNPVISSDCKVGSGSVYFGAHEDGFAYSASPAFKFGALDFTIEAWVKFDTDSNANCIFSNYTNWTSGAIYIGTHPSTGVVSVWAYSLGGLLLQEQERTVNEWVHYAVVRNGSTLTLYKNGTNVASTSVSGSIGDVNCPVFVGYAGDNPTGYGLIGYLDAFKISKDIARYTSDFTPEGYIPPPPPAQPELVLSYDMGNSSSYSGSGSALYDLSGYNNIGTLLGYYVYEPAYGGVIDFNGANATISINNTGTITPPKITLEAWVKPSNISTYQELLRMNNGMPIYLLSFQETNIISFGLSTSVSGYNELDVTLDPNQVVEKWCHFVATYESGSKKLYLNGTLIGEAYDQGIINYDPSSIAHIGSSSAVVEFLDGKIGLFNIYNYALTSTEVGNRYDTTKSRFDDGIVKLDGYDTPTVLYNGVTFSTNKNMFTFDGVNDYAVISDNSNYVNLTDTNFIIDLWFKSGSFSQTQVIMTNSLTSDTSDYQIYIDGSESVCFSSDVNGVNLVATVPTMSINTWYNLTVVRNSGIVKIYLNGISYASLEFNVSNTLSGSIAVGMVPYMNQIPFNGYISDIKISKASVSDTDVLSNFNNANLVYNGFEAVGGVITTDSTYKYHTFKSSSDFQVLSGSKAIEFLLVGGGAGAGGNVAGGGGAGGLKTFTATITEGTYPVVVGAGGVGAFTNYTSGQNSSFNNEFVYGGGRGKGDGVSGSNGGSGGGGSASPGLLTATQGFPGQGNNGGNGEGLYGGPHGGGGGGGGAATTGQSPVTGHAGHGGDGMELIEWSTATSTGVNNRYAAGGGGGGYTPYGQAPGNGGNGGGGNGNGYGDGQSAVINTGSGAGAGSGGYASNGGNGGSGIVIIRYTI